MKTSGWGRYPVVDAKVLRATSRAQLSAFTDDQQEAVIARGNGRSYGDSALSEMIILPQCQGHFVDFDADSGILNVQSFVLLSDIIETFAPRGWFPEIVPGTRLITVGGAIASDVHGKNHHVSGCFSECVLSLTLMMANGETVHCSRDSNSELFRATCGGMGLTGIILDTRIRLKRINSRHIRQQSIKTTNLDETLEAFGDTKDAPYSVAWIDCLAKDRQLGRSVLMTGDFDDDGNLDYRPRNSVTVPGIFPGFALNRMSVTAFNAAYYAKAPNGLSNQVVDIDTFFFPLDAINAWNRIYGRKGFVQYQFILPLSSGHDGLRQLLSRIAQSGLGSFLAVLKLYGPKNRNYLSFPLEGYSLALDFKVSPQLLSLLDELDRMLETLGGRVYLAKDARMSKSTFDQGYPRADEFRTLRRDYGLHERFQSIQSVRLGI